MTAANHPITEPFSVKSLWRDSPGPFKIGAVLAVAGWFISISSAQLTSTNGVLTSCSYSDFFKIGGGAVVVVLAVVGVIENARTRRYRLPTVVAGAIAAVLLVVGVLLVLRGLAVYPTCESLVDIS